MMVCMSVSPGRWDWEAAQGWRKTNKDDNNNNADDVAVTLVGHRVKEEVLLTEYKANHKA